MPTFSTRKRKSKRIMRHRRKTKKLGRSTSHRAATVAALVCALIEQRRIKTTLAKAKEARTSAEKMVTHALKGTLASRRLLISRLHRPKHAAILCDEIAPLMAERNGGYTRILKLGQRSSDGSEMALLEWVEGEIPDRKKKAKAQEKTAEKA
jgi:large subunit ribosomal protein L17